ncbi:MAG: xanthine dehydrogenase family protein subunit M [Acidobacteria bacterium]|nr:xanthine dehydrogenase family protein subunit M [Acidobacteriota bacterium]MBI3661615.1 xanthine dehydrogenase family protein subunit M [Acidobacteriota bacterium]
MIPAPFEYHAPKSLEEALRLLDRHGDEAKLLAGGHSLLPMMKLRLAAPRFVIDLGRLKGLDYIREEQGMIAIGAMTTHAEIENSSLLRAKCPLLSETAAAIGDVQVRNRGTLGGSLAHADPAADYPASILALEAQMTMNSSMGVRAVDAAEFFLDMLTTQLRPGEILTEIRVPALGKGTGAAYCKLSQPASGYAVVGVAARVTLAAGKLAQIAVGVTGVGPKAYRAVNVEDALRGKKASEKLLAEAARHAARGVEALADLHASAGYRSEMAAVFTRRALERAVARAAGTKA